MQPKIRVAVEEGTVKVRSDFKLRTLDVSLLAELSCLCVRRRIRCVRVDSVAK